MTPNNQFLLLLEDVRIAPGASSETAFDQQVMQVNQRRHRKARRAPIAIPAQATASTPATTVTTPGAAATWTTRPATCCSL